ncbi:hypothetical protein [Novosphingobium lentum]|uniref:hypothetical protein n=1 Tax=Novosphingobium lentum TaxID=145287 RepID=UPI00082F8832|nr:hypothetical protein [Novosphingobium lentum]
MREFMLLMHDDTLSPSDDSAWEAYFSALRASGVFDGGSSIGGGQAVRKTNPAGPVSLHINGFIRLRADSESAAMKWVESNPVFLAGGTVEVRELLRD